MLCCSVVCSRTTICTQCMPLSFQPIPVQKLLERPMAKFRVVLKALWTKDKDFEELDTVARDDDVMVSHDL